MGIVELGTNIAPPTATVFQPRNKRIHVGPTTFAPNNTGRAGLDRGNVVFFALFGWGKGAQNGAKGDFTSLRLAGRLGNLGGGQTKETLGNIHIVINIIGLLLGLCHAGHTGCLGGGLWLSVKAWGCRWRFGCSKAGTRLTRRRWRTKR